MSAIKGHDVGLRRTNCLPSFFYEPICYTAAHTKGYNLFSLVQGRSSISGDVDTSIGLLSENGPIIVDLTKDVADFISRTVIDSDKLNSQVELVEDFSNQANADFSGVVSKDNDADIDSIFYIELRFSPVVIFEASDRGNPSFFGSLVSIE